jgi:hypothetical protein
MEGLAPTSALNLIPPNPENASTFIPTQPIDPPPPPPSTTATNATTTTTLEPTDHTGSPPRKKIRRAIDDAKRRALRRYRAEHPRASQKELQQWFTDKFYHTISQSTISEILSTKYTHLDNDTRKDFKLKGQRTSKADYPDLEAALFEWQQKIQKMKGTITGDILKAKASEIWSLLPQYKDLPEPKWSNGWLEGWKKRHNVKQYVNHGEAGTADIDNPDNIQTMEENRKLTSEYPPNDVLNMDESGLFWKLSPNKTLATESGSGGKKTKDRVTIVLTVNATGSDKIEPWIIGKSKEPRCFKNINRRLLGVQYRYNKTKWMTGLICQEYLLWLNNKMKAQNRHVLLFMDNFSGHELGVQLVGGLDALSNVKIRWLPPNTTSHWQPLDQGIIASFKLHYRRPWVRYMIKQMEKGKNPQKTVTLRHAISWIVQAWNHDVKAATIKSCWFKSTLIKKSVLIPGGDEDAEFDPFGFDDEIRVAQEEEEATTINLMQMIQSTKAFNQPLLISQFINPSNEVIEDNPNEVFTSIIERYTETPNDNDESSEEEDQEDIIPVLYSDALKALETLTLYEQQQEDGQNEVIRKIQSISATMRQRRLKRVKQVTLDGSTFGFIRARQ